MAVDFQLRQNDRQTPLITAIVGRLTTGNYAGSAPGTMLAEIQNKTAAELAWAAGDVPVWAGAPKDLMPPYVAVASSNAKPWGTKTCAGSDFTVTLLVISTFSGFDECDRVAQAILDALSFSRLDLSADGLELIMFRQIEEQSATLEADGRTNFRRMSFRAIVADLAQQNP